MSVNIFAAVGALMLILTDTAHAYLDPGSGSMYLQILLGGLAGMGLVLKVFWANILATLGLGKKEEKSPDPDAAEKKEG
jgi:hypothetical protein